MSAGNRPSVREHPLPRCVPSGLDFLRPSRANRPSQGSLLTSRTVRRKIARFRGELTRVASKSRVEQADVGAETFPSVNHGLIPVQGYYPFGWSPVPAVELSLTIPCTELPVDSRLVRIGPPVCPSDFNGPRSRSFPSDVRSWIRESYSRFGIFVDICLSLLNARCSSFRDMIDRARESEGSPLPTHRISTEQSLGTKCIEIKENRRHRETRMKKRVARGARNDSRTQLNGRATGHGAPASISRCGA